MKAFIQYNLYLFRFSLTFRITLNILEGRFHLYLM